MSPSHTPATTTTVDASPARRRGIAFWIARYLPAEIAGTAAMIAAGLAVAVWTDNPALIAGAALVGEIIGFYLVLGLVVAREQSRLGVHGRRLLASTFVLLVAEFGAAELLDTFLIRPVALMVGVLVLAEPVWGLLAGKVLADVVFYALAAGAFTITDRAGLRRRASRERAS